MEAVDALNKADTDIHNCAKSVLIEEAGALVAKFDEAKRAALALQDDIAALAQFAPQRGTQTYVEARLPLPVLPHAAVTTPMDFRPMLPAAQTYAARRLPAWRALFEALMHDADAKGGLTDRVRNPCGGVVAQGAARSRKLQFSRDRRLRDATTMPFGTGLRIAWVAKNGRWLVPTKSLPIIYAARVANVSVAARSPGVRF